VREEGEVDMPAHFTHIYAARRVADHLASGLVPDWTGPAPTDPAEPTNPVEPVFTSTVGRYGPAFCGKVMKDWEKFTAIGAIGPDLFYFSQDYSSKILGSGPIPPSDEIMLALAVYYFDKTVKEDDYEPLLIILDKVDSTLGALVRFLIKLMKIWDDFVAMWRSTIGPIVDAASSALDDLTGGVLSSLRDGIAQLKTALVNLVEEEVLTYKDIFAGFDTCVAKGWDEQSFLWGDVLHYRRTTEVARRMVEHAERIRVEDPTHPDRFYQMLAFALGWMTHVGVDTVGHSFVNEQCGGPFRNHPQRHHLIENHIDAWTYRKCAAGGPIPADPWGANETYPDLSNSGIAFAVQMTTDDPHGDQRPDVLPDDPKAAKAALATDGELPSWMADAIVLALIDTYGDDPKRPSARPTHPKVYQGSDFQKNIDENKLTQAFLDATGHGPDGPFQQLLDDIAPRPSFNVPVGFPLPWQVQGFYRLMISFYQLSYRGGWELDKPRKPPFFIVPPASDITNLLGPPDFNGPSTGDPIEDVCNLLKALVEWVTKVLDAALKLVGDLIKMLASPSSYLIRLGLYELALMVWDITQKVHDVMAHTGFFIPHGEERYPPGGPDGELKLGNEIDEPLITLGGTVDGAFQQALADALDPFANLDHSAKPIVGHPVPDPNYPYYMVIGYDDAAATTPSRDNGSVLTEEYKRPWAYPQKAYQGKDLVQNRSELSAGTELAPVPPNAPAPLLGPYPGGTTPDEVFFRTTSTGNPRARLEYEQSQTPEETDRLNLVHLRYDGNAGSPLGDPIPFTSYLIGRLLNDRTYSTQFNLDSDRAYAYLTWDWVRSGTQIPADLPGISYAAPKTPPQLAKEWKDPLAPLLMEYVDGPGVPSQESVHSVPQQGPVR
jgi:hypothetical protein